MRDSPAGPLRPRSRVLGPALGLVVGVPIAVIGIAVRGIYPDADVIAILDTATVTLFAATAIVAGIDAELRRVRDSLPTIALAFAGSVGWIVHLAVFPGAVAVVEPAGTIAANLFVLLHLAIAVLLAVALVQPGGEARSRRPVAMAAVGGTLLGAGLVAVAAASAAFVPAVAPDGRFTPAGDVVAASAAVPTAIGVIGYLSRRRGDERVSAGVSAALVLSLCSSISFAFLPARYSGPWYASHALEFLVAPALLIGQLSGFVVALRVERRTTATLRTTLEMAEAMARQIDLGALMDRLMAGAMNAVGADRATLMTVDGDRLTVEAALDRRGTPAPLGIQLPITNLQVAGKPVVPEAIRAGRPVATAAYDTGPLAADHAASVEGVRHYITWPLLLGGEVDAVLFLARRRDVGFSGRDVDLLAEFATIAALLLRNARLLRSAEAASVAKSNFLNLAAHELRTPVAVIRGYLNLLAEGDVGRLSTRQREVLGIVSGKTEELSRQVEQLLLASRVGAAAVRREPVGVFDIVATCREALTRAQPRADALGATLALEATDAVFAHGSPTSVGIVLDNLVNNALTYSRPPARVTLAVGDGDDASITVEDAGIGIAPGDRAHVFDQFHRIDRPDFGYPSGTGLGLYIARELVEADGGTLELEWSEVDVGSRFRLRLPAAGPPADAKRKPKLRERVRATSP